VRPGAFAGSWACEASGEFEVDVVGILQGQDGEPECGQYSHLAVRDAGLFQASGRLVQFLDRAP
jgi:hypothetical protein